MKGFKDELHPTHFYLLTTWLYIYIKMKTFFCFPEYNFHSIQQREKEIPFLFFLHPLFANLIDKLSSNVIKWMGKKRL